MRNSPHLHVWDWRVALYLFLGGLSAGLAVMASDPECPQGRRAGRSVNELRSARQMLVPVILSVGMLFIFLDLERKLNVFWFYLTVQPLSPMSWGSWGLLAFYPVSILFAIAAIPAESRHRLLFPAAGGVGGAGFSSIASSSRRPISPWASSSASIPECC